MASKKYQAEATALLSKAQLTTNQDRAIRLCEDALGLDPDNRAILYQKALLLTARQRWGDALAAYEDAIARSHEDPSLYYNAGLVSLNAGWLERAEAYFLQAKALDPFCEGAHYQLASLYFRMGNLDTAADLAETALRLRPTECTIDVTDFLVLIDEIEAVRMPSANPSAHAGM
jgi:tetratricopeptide (TPR) repeat protein